MKNTKKDFIKRVSVVGLFILFVTTINTNAQETKGGIKGGLNLSYLSIDDANDNNIIPGFHAGFWGKMMVTDKFGIQPEVLFSTKGVKTVYDKDFLGIDVADGETRLNMNYIDIPVYLAFNLSEDFDFHFGPYVGILMNANVDTDTEILDFIEVDDMEEIDRSEFNTIDYGLSGGLGFNFDPVTLGFNYTLGLNKVAKDGESMESLLGDAKNNTIQVYVGLAF